MVMYMKYVLGGLMAIFVILMLGCNTSQPSAESDRIAIAEDKQTDSGAAAENVREQEPKHMERHLSVKIGNRVFSATLKDNMTTKEFTKLLPLEMTMRELNDNEKYCRLSQSLPTQDKNPGQIHAGDLMLYDGNTVVLFYRDFATSYRYTPLGRIVDTAGLTEAVGNGDISVVMSLGEN